MTITRRRIALLPLLLFCGLWLAAPAGLAAGMPDEDSPPTQDADPLVALWPDFDAARYGQLIAQYGGHVADHPAATTRLALGLARQQERLSSGGALLVSLCWWINVDFLAAHRAWEAAGHAPLLPQAELDALHQAPWWLATGIVTVERDLRAGAWAQPLYDPAQDRIAIRPLSLGTELRRALDPQDTAELQQLVLRELLRAAQDHLLTNRRQGIQRAQATLFGWQLLELLHGRAALEAEREELLEDLALAPALLASAPPEESFRSRLLRLLNYELAVGQVQRELAAAFAAEAIRRIDAEEPPSLPSPELERLASRWQAALLLREYARDLRRTIEPMDLLSRLKATAEGFLADGLLLGEHVPLIAPALQLHRVSGESYKPLEQEREADRYAYFVFFQLLWAAVNLDDPELRAFLGEVVLGSGLDAVGAAISRERTADGLSRAP